MCRTYPSGTKKLIKRERPTKAEIKVGTIVNQKRQIL